MRIDLERRLTFGFIFGAVCLVIQLGATIAGVPVNDALTAAFSSIVLGTFGVGVLAGRKHGSDDDG